MLRPWCCVLPLMGCATAQPQAVSGIAVSEAVNLQVGGEVESYQIDRCFAVFQQAGFVVDANSSHTVLVTLKSRNHGGNRLRVLAGPIVLDQPKEQRTVSALCEDAVVQLRRVAAIESETIRANAAHSAPAVIESRPTADTEKRSSVQSTRTTVPSVSAKDAARDTHKRALRHFNLGQFDDAIKDWSSAYELDPKPEFLYNIGSAYQQRGEIGDNLADLRRALHFFQRFREASPKSELDLRELEAEIHKRQAK